MVNWTDPNVIASQFTVFILLQHSLAGVYFWEFAANLGYDWQLISGQRKLSWTSWVYIACRCFGVACVSTIIAGFDIGHEFNCQAWLVCVYLFSYATLWLSSALIGIRVVAIWNRSLPIIIFVAAMMLGFAGTFLHGLIIARSTWDPISNGCGIAKTEGNLANTTGGLIVDVGLLLVMLVGLLRRREARKFGLWQILWTQGLIWLVLATMAEVPSVFIALNLNPPMNIMFLTPQTVILRNTHVQELGELCASTAHSSDFSASINRRRPAKDIENTGTSMIPLEVSVHRVQEEHYPSRHTLDQKLSKDDLSQEYDFKISEAMEHEQGDEYVRRIATFIRTNESRLAESGFQRRRRTKTPTPAPLPSALNPLSWYGSSPAPPSRPKPLAFSIDTHRLFYILIRLEALGLDVGSLDVKVDRPARPMSYVNIHGSDTSDVMSLSSIRSSLSAVSKFSLGSGFWGRPPPPSLDDELKYIFSSLTKIPALALRAPGPKKIAEIANDPPNENALPLRAFRNLQALECVDIDPRTLLGWDRLAESLWSLTIKRSGLDDVSDVFVGAVLDDLARREGRSPSRRRRTVHGPSRQASFHSTVLPESITEDPEEQVSTPTVDGPHRPPSPSSSISSGTAPELPSTKWACLRYLSLADNALTFLPTTPLRYLTSVTHLDLSSNLLVSVPHGLSELYSLVSLNLSDNMIDSVLGIYKQLGQILTVNLAHNRLESLCGLERLMALERVDVRHNVLEESAEVGRLATLPNIVEVWVEGNPFVEYEESYRVHCFDMFCKEGKSIVLDGSPAGFYEKRNMTSAPPEQMSSTRPLSSAHSPPVVPVGAAASPATSTSTVPTDTATKPSHSPPSSTNPSPFLAAAVGGKARKKKLKRIVDLDGRGSEQGDGTNSSVASVPSPPPELAAPPKRPAPKHRRSHTDAFPPNESSFAPTSATISRGSTILSAKSRAQTRRSRVSASVFEAPSPVPLSGDDADEFKQANAFRARIEALRADMGEGWLKVLSQSQLGQQEVASR
ncbi:hypothetical protein OF83DRAFT_1174317 [Amylostereum chailletii]|nr:hypothetical protein OF83DRAFT_1174317 [Amylostereum chailletii]